MTTGTRIDLWFWRPEGTVGEIARWRKHLSQQELERVSRFMFPKDQVRFTVCRYRMRRILGWYLGVQAKNVTFGSTGRNKPVLADHTTGITFNLSHTEGLACLAVTRNAPVGVDLECVRDIKDDFIAYALNPAEHAEVVSLASAERQAAFLRYWTAKEAYLKAIGSGLWQSLKTFDVKVPVASELGDMKLASIPRIDDECERERNWHLYSFQATPRHLGALAVVTATGEGVQVCCRWLGDASPS